MSTEERIVALEQGIAVVQRDFIVHMSESNRHMGAITKVLMQQEANIRDLQHDATILLGIAGSQGKDIKAMQNDLGEIKERLNGVDSRLERIESMLAQILTRFPEKP